MSKASGLLLILAGLGAAAYVMPTSVDPREQDASALTDIAKSPPLAGMRTAVVQDVQETKPAVVRSTPPPTATQPQPALRPAEPKMAAPPAATWKTPVVVTPAQRPAPPSRVAALPDRASLPLELQRELRRVGCYDGQLNGTWTTQSRRAMKAFTDQVNATLPVDEPDYILLTLVQGHQDKACGKPCPAGQGVADDGRCVPSAILAHAARKAAPSAAVAAAPKGAPPTAAITGWSTTATAAAPTTVPLPTAATRPPAEGRMALAGPGEPEANEWDRPARARSNGAPSPRAVPFSGPVPRVGVYERRPPPPRYVQAPRRGPPTWTRGFFKRLDSNGY